MTFLGRQPVFTSAMETYGYELLYRSNEINRADFHDGNRATSSVLVNSFFEFGLKNIVGESRAFINLPRDFIIGTYELPFDPEQIVLEVLETISFDDTVAEALLALRRKGFILCLDDFILPESGENPFVDYVDIVKLELPAYSPPRLLKTAHYLQSKGVEILAEKVETREEFELCRRVGCDFFQGYFFCKPNILKQEKIPKNRFAIIRLLKRVHDPLVSFSELEELIAQDVTLSYRILKYINSAVFCLRSRVESIKRALSYIGLEKLKQWIYIMSIADISNDRSIIPLIETSMIRSKMCELIGNAVGASQGKNIFATVGLFSTLDAVVGIPLQDILEELPFSQEINRALLHAEGLPGEILHVTRTLESGKPPEEGFQNISSKRLGELYIDAIQWVNKNMNEIFS